MGKELGAGWALPVQALAVKGERGSRTGGVSPVREGAWPHRAELPQFPHAALPPWAMSSVRRHPCSHGDQPGAHEHCRLSPAGHRPHHPAPLREPRNKAGEEEVGGPQPPALGCFHLHAASCVYIFPAPMKPGLRRAAPHQRYQRGAGGVR